MRKLILIKHARPQVEADRPGSEWQLSEEGRRACPGLAQRLAAHEPATIISSDEPKALQTAELVAGVLGRPLRTMGDLHEHQRDNVPYMPTPEFISWMAMFFRKPGERVLGDESADEALERFGRAVDGALAAHPEGNLAIITHGTVIALLAAGRAGRDGYQLWRRMQLPSYLVFALPQWELVEIVERVG
jgi:broad specificity phosphatase PhoE